MGVDLPSPQVNQPKIISMSLFDRFKKKPQAEEDGFSRISSISGDPDRWAELNDDELQQAVMIQCITYGVTEDASRIRPLFGF